ncbi:MAG: T9SS type A sorting domain-containing protein [Lewinellaceae bacterium]|nr:T9SS type A sorting domain-containing protein [Lewinellaceae bacterium]
MKKLRLLLICIGIFPVLIHAQSAGDFRSKTAGAFSNKQHWETYNGTTMTWEDASATPTSADGVITISHVMELNQDKTLDQLVITASGSLQTGNMVALTINNGSGTDFQIFGTFYNFSNVPVGINSGVVVSVEPGGRINTDAGASINVASSGALSMAGNSVLDGAGVFTLSTGATLEIGSINGISASGALGNIQNTGARTFNASANYTYIGTAAQSTGTGLPTALTGELKINNTGAGTTLTAATAISHPGHLNLTDGNLITIPNLLTLGDDVTVQNSSADSFVDGPLKKVGNDAFTFPIGDAGKFAQLGISAPAAITDEFTAEYFRVPYTNVDNFEMTMTRVSKIEHWILDRTAGTSDVKVTLHWDKGSTTSGITDISTLVVARYDDMGMPAEWKNEGLSFRTGDEISGRITSFNAISNFSPFTFGATTAANPLPIELTNFSGSVKGQAIQLLWSTATEQNNDYMAVERSADGRTFQELGRVQGAGTTLEPQEYTFLDEKPLRGLNYYRLRQVDFDGAVEYHKVISVEFNGKGSAIGVSAFPNPANEMLYASWAASTEQPATLRVLDMTGRQVAQYQAPAGTANFEVPLDRLQAGLYMLEVRQGSSVEVVRFRKG